MPSGDVAIDSEAIELSPWRRLLVALLLVAGVVAVFGQSVGFEFLEWDDPLYVNRNPQVLQGLTGEGLAWALTTHHAASWQPLVWLSYMVDVELFGPGPAGPHLVNVLLHALNTVLALALYWRLDPRRPARGICAAALFGLHPLRVESVVWVSERKDVLCVFLALLATLGYLAYRRRPSAARYLAVTAAVAAALAAKPLAVTLPLLFLLLDHWPLRRLSRAPATWRAALLEKLPWALLSAGAALAAVGAQGESGAIATGSELSLGARLANAAVAVPRYLGLTLRPQELSALYPHPWLPGGVPPAPWVIVAAFFGVALTLVLALAARRHRELAVGWLWFLVALMPTLGLVQVGEQALADRYTYLPHVGLFLVLVWGIGDLLLPLRGRHPALARGLAMTLGALFVVVAAARAAAQVPAWRSSETLFRRSLAATPRNPLLLYHLARVRMLAGDTVEAEALLRGALALRPLYAEPHRLLGLVQESRGELEAATRELTIAVAMRPDVLSTRLDLVRVLLAGEALVEAERQLRHLLGQAPESPQVQLDLGRLRALQGRNEEAERAWREAVRLAPDWEEPLQELARLQRSRSPGPSAPLP